MASNYPLSKVVTPEALEEARRNVWLVLKAHGWEPERELDQDVAETLMSWVNGLDPHAGTAPPDTGAF